MPLGVERTPASRSAAGRDAVAGQPLAAPKDDGEREQPEGVDEVVRHQRRASCGLPWTCSSRTTAPLQLGHPLGDVALDYLRSLPRWVPTGPDAYLFPNVRGRRMSRQRVTEIVHEAAEHATERFVERGLPPLPNTTPHSLRRTYISIALLANRFDVMWVMSQVGHADSKMTTDVYAQLQQRARRDQGRAFDALVRRAREHLQGA